MKPGAGLPGINAMTRFETVLTLLLGALAGQVVATRIPAWVEWLQSLWFPWS